ncbi:MAG: hypothetical protein GY809_23605 [Planctomycetes bacterium]|nr:hypothetical protein [Planctomycetota bacterium]
MRYNLAMACLLSILSITLAEESAPTSKQTVFGELTGQVLSTGSRRVRLMDPEGNLLWQYRGSNVHDCWMLANGHVLVADGVVREIDPKTNEVVFQYRPKVTKGGGAYACQRLENGLTLIGENSTGRILEVDKDGDIRFELKVQPYKPGDHHNMRMVRKLRNGHYLVCHSGEHRVREYTPQGEIVFDVEVSNLAFSAVRLENGHTLVGQIDLITEFDAQGRTVWQFSNTQFEGLYINAICGLHALPNGHIVVGVYAAYKDGQGTAMFEITRDKQLVWRYADPSADGTIMGVQMLDAKGRALPGDTLR